MWCGRAVALSLLLAVSAQANATDAVPDELTMSHTFDPVGSIARVVVHLRLPIKAVGQINQIEGELHAEPVHRWRVSVLADGRRLSFDGPVWMARISRSDEFLAVDHFPEIRFDSDIFDDALLHAGGILRGALTLRGRTRPVSLQLLPTTCPTPGFGCDIRVQGTIRRQLFEMTSHRLTVKNDVDLDFRIRLQTPPTL